MTECVFPSKWAFESEFFVADGTARCKGLVTFVCDSWLALKRGSSNRRGIRSVYDAAPAGEKTNRKEMGRERDKQGKKKLRER